MGGVGVGPDYGGARCSRSACVALVQRLCGGCAVVHTQRACTERAWSVQCARSGAGCGGTLKLRKLRLPAQEYRRCRGRLTGSGTAAGAVAATDGGPVGAGVRHACWLGDAGTD